MAHRRGNLLKQTSGSTGLTVLTLTGAPTRPYRRFSAALEDGDTVDVIVKNREADEWQAARYVYSEEGDSLTFYRLWSSSTGTQVDFSAGTKDVENGPLAEDEDGHAFTVTGDYTARDGDVIDADTTEGSLTVTLPASLGANAKVVVRDPNGKWTTNPVAFTVTGDGDLDGVATGGESDRQSTTSARYVFADEADGWVTLEYALLRPFLV